MEVIWSNILLAADLTSKLKQVALDPLRRVLKISDDGDHRNSPDKLFQCLTSFTVTSFPSVQLCDCYSLSFLCTCLRRISFRLLHNPLLGSRRLQLYSLLSLLFSRVNTSSSLSLSLYATGSTPQLS